MEQMKPIIEVIIFFMVHGESEENEEQHFEKILNFQIVSAEPDERRYELNNKLERLEVLKQQLIKQSKPSFYHIAKIDRFAKFCNNNVMQTASENLIDDRSESKLSDLITSENAEEIINAIKIQYKNIGGKRLKLLLIALQELNLLPKERIAKSFHNLFKKEVEWNIATYEAMNNYIYNDGIDNEELKKMKLFIESHCNTQ